jgi:hypothetical protein
MDCRSNPTHVHYMRTSNGDLKCQHASVMAVTKWKYERDVYPSQQKFKMLRLSRPTGGQSVKNPEGILLQSSYILPGN